MLQDWLAPASASAAAVAVAASASAEGPVAIAAAGARDAAIFGPLYASNRRRLTSALPGDRQY